MPTWQFDTQFQSDGSLVVPPDVAAQLHPEDALRVVISTENDEEDAQWQRLVTEQFLKGYGPGDDIYDELSSG
ncbi:hypothetical protein [Bythopirellula goksoeyrii]|uniref:Uncharacterized protein n=1 Tax=Bythopirellula goksoeyrii TaxID=1400387 RepID=A0A5B9QKM3_9BACT|nr:hypothetical protein [Bythopirellula goksoeyrii]QEG34633.1 hypothetical protein Pr1d_19150 [Bythopirellula goksoeyrii]